MLSALDRLVPLLRALVWLAIVGAAVLIGQQIMTQLTRTH